MSFMNDLKKGKNAEEFVANWLRKTNKIESVDIHNINDQKMVKCGDRRKSNYNTDVATFEIAHGDMTVTRDDSSTFRVEVKRDASAQKTKNLFLETLSDNGERTGNRRVGWYRNPRSKFEYYCFVLVGVGLLFVKREELNAMDLKKERTAKMMYDQTQMNRSEGKLVKYKRVLKECASAKLIEGVYC